EPAILVERVFGSGYPGDPNTVKWLRASVDPVFGFPDIIRFSWSTCVKLLDDLAVPVAWPDDANDEEKAGCASAAKKASHRSGTASTIHALFATASSDASRQRSRFFGSRRPILLSTTL
ncbi:Ribonuclease H2 subunit A, partial [Coemansia erecta]